MSTNRALTKNEQAVLEIITDHRALISIVFDVEHRFSNRKLVLNPEVNYQEIDQNYLDQIADPAKNRPSRYAQYFVKAFSPYNISLVALEENLPISNEIAKKAETENTPILIKRNNTTFSIYGYSYLDLKWQETPLTNLSHDELSNLQKLTFDGRVIKDLETKLSLDTIMPKGHFNLPPVTNKMNMKTLDVHQHKPGQNRFTKHKDKEVTHTAKTATSLIPPDPRFMELFYCDDGIGFLWDINDCNTKKEKYVFNVDGGTDSCYWLDLNDEYELELEGNKYEYRIIKTAEEKIASLRALLKENPLATIESLRERNNMAIKDNKPILWNEFLVGLPKGIIRAVFATQDVRSSRLRAWKGMQHAKEKLHLEEDLPVFILQPYYAKYDEDPYSSPDRPAVFRFYSLEECEADLKSELADRQAEVASLNMIKNHRALALLVSDEKKLESYLDQISDPTENRPSLSTEFFKKQGTTKPDVLKKINFKTWKVHDHKPGQCRDTKHKGEVYSHTAKLPTVLLPPEPQWMDLAATDSKIALLFDIEACNLKNEKYVFSQPENMDDCFWLNVDSDEKLSALKQRFANAPVGSIDAVRAQNDKAVSEQKIIGRNTIFAGLPKGHVNGIVCLANEAAESDDCEQRIQAQKLALLIKDKLKLTVNVPIFIRSKNGAFIPYTDIAQLFDQNEYAQQQLRKKIPSESSSTPVVANINRRKHFVSSQNVDQGYVIVSREEIKQEETENTKSRCNIM